MKTPKHPLQPIIIDKHKVARFKSNRIVEWLLENARAHGVDMNTLAMMHFDKNDRWQFAQLIGYSVSGIGDLSYRDKAQLAEADEIVSEMILERETKKAARKAAKRSLTLNPK